MDFGFNRPPSYKGVPRARVLLSLLAVCVCLFFAKSFFLLESVFTEKKETLLDELKDISVTIAGLNHETGYTGILINKILTDGAQSINKEEFLHLVKSLKLEKTAALIPAQYAHIPGFLKQLSGFGTDLYSLLGYESEQSYLVVLQNTNEKRPNGGFFGSFALIKFSKGELTHLEIIDSYLPNFDRPNTYITGPERFDNFLPEREIYFIGANKVGFTYHDGAHIKTLYEKSYPGQRIRGVLFLTTDMFSYILDDFELQMRERQFVNAAIDIIRGEQRRGKKEVYLKNSQRYFEEHKKAIITGVLQHFDEILHNHRINAYLVDISGPFHGFIRRNKLATRFEQETAYIRESNISYNKIDGFVDKTVRCFDANEQTIMQEANSDILSLLPFTPGTYTCKISYTLDVPQEHFAYIQSLEQAYNISLGEREKHILGLHPKWDSRILVHLPQTYTIEQVSGDVYESEIFSTPFSSAAMFKSFIGNNGGSSHIFIKFTVTP